MKVAKKRGRPINRELEALRLETIQKFVVRNFGNSGKVGYIGAKGMKQMKGYLSAIGKAKYKMKVINGVQHRVQTRKRPSPRVQIEKLREGGSFDRNITTRRYLTADGEIDVEKCVKRVFGRRALEHRRHIANTDTNSPNGLQIWGWQRAVKSILQNNSDVYELLDDAGKQLVRDYNALGKDEKADPNNKIVKDWNDLYRKTAEKYGIGEYDERRF